MADQIWPRDEMKGIGGRIRQRREELKLSQDGLADLMGTSRGALAQWERGETMPRSNRIPEIARTLGVSEAWLVSGNGLESTIAIAQSAEPARIPIEGLVGAGIWIEDGPASGAGGRPREVPMLMSEKYPNIKAVPFEVRGDDFRQSFPHLSDLFAVSIEETGHHIKPGEWILLETRQGPLIERSAWRVEAEGPVLWLVSESALRQGSESRLRVAAVETDPNRTIAWLCDRFIASF